jgi:hypothetical protein
MHDLLQWMTSVDLGALGQTLLGFLEGADPCFLCLIVGVLVFFGSRMVVGQPAIQSWGLRLAALAFLLYGGYAWFSAGEGSTRTLGGVVLRAACVAGCVLAATWTILPVLNFIHGHLRLALAVFLGYAAYAGVAAGGYSSEMLPGMALKGLFASGLALVIAWIVEPFWNFFSSRFLPQRSTRGADAPPAATPQDEVPVPTAVATPRRRTTVVLAPLASEDEEDQRRRDRARLQLELAYVQALPSVAAWFPRPTYEEFLRRHLADHLPPEDVEDNARQLQAVLRQHQEQAEGRGPWVETQGYGSLEELGRWLLQEQQRIQALPVEQPVKQSQLLDLHQRYLVLAARTVQRQATLPC